MGVTLQIHLASTAVAGRFRIKGPELSVILRRTCRLVGWRAGGHLNSMEGQCKVALHLPFLSPLQSERV